MHYAVVDIGSPKQGNLGWWVTGPFIEDGGTDPDKMIAALTEAVHTTNTVAVSWKVQPYLGRSQSRNGRVILEPSPQDVECKVTRGPKREGRSHVDTQVPAIQPFCVHQWIFAELVIGNRQR
ncbi:hypothetical protein JNB91_26760 [Rhizobium wenxiniae]|uniref:hypothetical protein n=1 Tax=Rhizobium wenxiniae TaxID=1737357 RepID=UPI001C6E06C1|nr:hypothetical protein [Rhizobium wenxiniae]MBW9091410.1 hypothetical protein [Rhizobium wenxiniae]